MNIQREFYQNAGSIEMIQWTFVTAQNGFKEFTVIKSFSTEFWIEH